MTNFDNDEDKKKFDKLIESLENDGNYSISNLNSSIIMEHKKMS